MNQRIVLTGGPCSGKTTLIEALAHRGFWVVPEAAIQVIEVLQREMGHEPFQRWRREQATESQTLICERQIQLEAAAGDRDGGVVFLDRGLVDGLAYCEFHRTPPPALLRGGLPLEGRYSRVFVLDTLANFRARAGTGRRSSDADSRAISVILERLYRQHGYAVTRVPELPVPERIERVLAKP